MSASDKAAMSRRFPCVVLPVVFLLAALLGAGDDAHAQATEGLAWEVQQLSDGLEPANSPTVVGDRAGGIHVFWTQGSALIAHDAIYYAHRQASEWVINDVVVGGDLQTPWAAIDSEGRIHLVWTDNLQLLYSNAYLLEAGSAARWSQPLTVDRGPVYNPIILSDSMGILHLTYWTCSETSSAVVYQRSTNNGLSWSAPRFFSPPNEDAVPFKPQIAITQDGTLHMVWSLVPTTSFYGGLGVYYAGSADAGQSWSEPVRLDADPNSEGKKAWNASIGVVGTSELHVVWDAHSEAGRRYHQWSEDGGVHWSAPEPIWGTFVSQTGPNPMAVDSAGNLYLFSAGTFDWLEPQGVYYSQWSGFDWTTPQPIAIDPNQPHWLAVALAKGNEFHVVWEAREQEPSGVWHASAQSNAPFVPPEVYPTVTLAPTALASAMDRTAAAPGAMLTPVPSPTRSWADQRPQMQTRGNPVSPLLIGILPVFLMIGAVAVIRIVRQRPH